MTETSLAGDHSVVLGIDDSPDDLGLLKLILGGAGYTFFAARNANAGCDLVLRCRPRLILLDVEMPDVDGFLTCRRLRSMQEARHIPIAFLTAYRTQADVERGMLEGGNDFIIKPFDRDTLLARVHHWTGRQVSGNPTVLPAADHAPIFDEAVLADIEKSVTHEEFATAVEDCLTSGARHLKRALECREAGDLAGLATEAHMLISVAGSYGLKRASQLARRLESACRAQEGKLAADLLGEMSTAAEAGWTALRARFGGEPTTTSPRKLGYEYE